MKKLFIAMAVLLLAQASLAQSIDCVLLRQDAKGNFKEYGDITKVNASSGPMVSLVASDQSFMALVQMEEDNRYTISLMKIESHDELRVLAFSLATNLGSSALVSQTEKVGISCSEKK